ncbi:MAG TPA: DUF192 domain-containing protein [Burkholderiales bacterium]
MRIAYSLAARLLALTREQSLPTRAGLLLTPAHGIHTLGMRFAVDVVFLTPQMRVTGLVSRVQPWRVLLAPRGTGRVLELAAGQIAATGLKPGTFIVVESNQSESRRTPIVFSLRLPLRHEDTRPAQ